MLDPTPCELTLVVLKDSIMTQLVKGLPFAIKVIARNAEGDIVPTPTDVVVAGDPSLVNVVVDGSGNLALVAQVSSGSGQAVASSASTSLVSAPFPFDCLPDPTPATLEIVAVDAAGGTGDGSAPATLEILPAQ
jgi:hypothetical protein